MNERNKDAFHIPAQDFTEPDKFSDGEQVSIIVKENTELGHIEGPATTNSYGHKMYHVRLSDGRLIPRIENLIH